MATYNVKNERIKKKYEQYLELDEQLSSQTIYAKIKDIRKYEKITSFKNLSTFNKDQALDFKGIYKRQDEVGFSTIWRTLKNLKEFFGWLSQQPKYRSKIKQTDIRAFNLSSKEENIAKSKGFKNVPTLEQIYKTIHAMPTVTDIDKRNQAMIALTICTGIRVNALISLKVKHIDEIRQLVKQDPREVQTKFSKTILTQFFPIDESIRNIIITWVKLLKEELSFGHDDPLFPAVLKEYDAKTLGFKSEALSRRHITSTTTAREIFKSAFQSVGIEYFNPHSFRDTLVQLGEKLCTTAEEFKAWSQNIGHSSPLTTFTSYGEVYPTRQCDIIKGLGKQ